jgi:hypothetical protein
MMTKEQKVLRMNHGEEQTLCHTSHQESWPQDPDE